jgi:hypothetical protein
MIGTLSTGLFGVGVPPVTNSYFSIATATPSGSSPYVEFTSIGSEYKHLQLRGVIRGTTNDSADITFNSDTGSNYSWHILYGTGSGSAAAASSASRANIVATEVPDTTYLTSAFIIDILDYGSTSKAKTIRILNGTDRNGSGTFQFMSGAWYNSSTAINSIKLTTRSGNLATGSHIALYGIKD